MSSENGRMLRFLYHTKVGRLVLKIAASRTVSRVCGAFLDSSLSKPLISVFVKNCGIDLSDYESDGFGCFNDCFTRKIKEGKRPLPQCEDAFMSPCDGLLSINTVTNGTVLPIKQSEYTIPQLLGGDAIAEKYQNGLCLVFRLCVDHYHRYSYIDNGTKGENVFIPGVLHTVRPIALAACPVFVQNCREYTVMHTDHFGDVTQVEVGAMLVGKIKNHHGAGPMQRGAEKGMFLYGGSTVVLLLEKDRVHLDPKLLEAAQSGNEVPVRMGEVLGKAAQ